MKKKFKNFKDDRGVLFPFELNDIPFVVKRIFTVFDVPKNSIRGGHSHYTTKQYIICIKGEVEVILHDGFFEKKVLLGCGDSVLIPELVWDSQIFKLENSQIIVFCSTEYDSNDYILDFKKFQKIKLNNEKSTNKRYKWPRWFILSRIFNR